MPLGNDQPGGDTCGNGLEDRGLVAPRNRRGLRHARVLAQDGPGLEPPTCLVAQSGGRLLDGGVDASGQRTHAVGGTERGDALEEQRVAAGDPQQREHEGGVELRHAVGREEGLCLLEVERTENHRERFALDLVEEGRGSRVPVGFAGAPAEHQRDAQPVERPDDEPGEQERPDVGPVHVVDHQTQRGTAAGRGQPLRHRPEPGESVGIHGRRAGVRREQVCRLRPAHVGSRTGCQGQAPAILRPSSTGRRRRPSQPLGPGPPPPRRSGSYRCRLRPRRRSESRRGDRPRRRMRRRPDAARRSARRTAPPVVRAVPPLDTTLRPAARPATRRFPCHPGALTVTRDSAPSRDDPGAPDRSAHSTTEATIGGTTHGHVLLRGPAALG